MNNDEQPRPPQGPAVPPLQPAPPIEQPALQDGAADGRNNAPGPARNKKEPRRKQHLPPPSTSASPPALRLVANLGYYTEQQLQTSMYVPTCITLFYMLYELDLHMVNSYRFLQSAPDWHPLISQIYISVLVYVQIFRAQREAGFIDPECLAFLRDFEVTYDLRNLHIPGPLVPFFQALTLSSGPFEWIGDICPGFQVTSLPLGRNHFALRRDAMLLLPNIALAIDQLQWLFAQPATVTDTLVASSFYSNIFNQAAAATGTFRNLMLCPNARFHVYMVPTQIGILRSRAAYFQFPTRYLGTSASTARLTISQFLRFTDAQGSFYNWFDTIARTMQRYCQFTHHSSTLQAISPTGLGASSVRVDFQANLSLIPAAVETEDIPGTGDNSTTPPTPATQRYQNYRPTRFLIQANHCDVELDELPEQYGLLTALNGDWHNVANGAVDAPLNATIREGPYWSLPVVRLSPTTQPTRGFGTIISSEYTSDTRIQSRD
jgi:hypothetical protein